MLCQFCEQALNLVLRLWSCVLTWNAKCRCWSGRLPKQFWGTVSAWSQLPLSNWKDRFEMLSTPSRRGTFKLFSHKIELVGPSPETYRWISYYLCISYPKIPGDLQLPGQVPQEGRVFSIRRRYWIYCHSLATFTQACPLLFVCSACLRSCVSLSLLCNAYRRWDINFRS